MVLRLPEDAVVDVDVALPRVLGRRRRSRRARRRAAGWSGHPRGAGLRVVAALRAPATRCGGRGDPPRGGPGPDGSGCAGPGPGFRRTSRRDEPARREPPGTADPAVSTDGRRRRRRAAVRRVDRAAPRPSWGWSPGSRARPRCGNVPATVSGVPTDASIEAVIEAGLGSHRGRSHRTRHHLPAQRGPARRRRSHDDSAVAVAAGAGRGLDPLPQGPGRGGPGPPARGGPAGPRRRRPDQLRAGTRRARLRGLPPRPLRPGRAVAHRRHQPGGRFSSRPGQGRRPTSARSTAIAATTRRPSPCSTRPAASPGEVADPRREAYALSMRGRVDLLCGRLDEADEHLTSAVALADKCALALVPPVAAGLPGRGPPRSQGSAGAAETLQQAFARACQLGDPCWEGIAARGLALVADASGETEQAFDTLRDARVRSNRLADPYVWLDVHILDALCELGRKHGHPETRRWVDAMRDLASRTGMKELTVRAMLHSAALGNARRRACRSAPRRRHRERAAAGADPGLISSRVSRPPTPSARRAGRTIPAHGGTGPSRRQRRPSRR